MGIPQNWAGLSLAKLIRENDKELLLDLDRSLFDGIYTPIFNIILTHFSEVQKIPSIDSLEALVTAKAPRDKLPAVTGVLTAIKSVDISQVTTKEIIKGLRDKKLMKTMDEQITALTNAAMQKDTEGVRQILNGVVEDINVSRAKPTDFHTAMEMEDNSKILTTGIENLDEHLVGFAGLSIVSALSGAGKTSFMLQSAVGMYLAGHSVLFISLELSAQVLGMRLKSMLTGIPFSKFTSKTLTDDEKKFTKEALDKFFGDPDKHFRIVTTPLDSEELLNLIKVEKSLYNIDAVFLDYLNLVGAPQGSEGGWRNLSDTAKSLHRLSMDIGVVTVSASQVDLEKAPKGGGMPQIRTRGSAELLFSATVLIFLFKPEGESDGGSDNPVVLYCLKNRNGPQKQLLMNADFTHMKFDFVLEL